MATIVNNPGGGDRDSGFGAGMVLGILVLLLVIFLIYWFGFRQSYTSPSDINVVVPTTTNGGNSQPTSPIPTTIFQSTSTTNSTSTTH